MPATSLVYSVVAPAVLKKQVASSSPLRPADCRLIAVNVTHTYEIRADDTRYALRLYCRGWRTAAEIVAAGERRDTEAPREATWSSFRMPRVSKPLK
jgi:hypothetical protein